MKKWMAVVLLLIVGLAAAPINSYAEDFDGGDSVFDKASDWAATIGKSPEERDSLIAQRKTERAAKRMSEAMKSSARKAGKEMKKMGNEMGKMFDN